MPGFPVVACEPSYSRGADQASQPDTFLYLSADEARAAEESFQVYCKPVGFYNILQQNAKEKNPPFLQRCLRYRINARRKKRIQMTVSLSWSVGETQPVFPLYICLAKLIKEATPDEDSAVYIISRIFIFRDSSEIVGDTKVEAKFLLPDVRRLAARTKSAQVELLFFTTVEDLNSSSGVNESLVPLNMRSSDSVTAGEYCLCGKVSLEPLSLPWMSSPNFHLMRSEMMSTVDLHPCFLKYGVGEKERSILIQVPKSSENVSASKKLQMTISAEELGAKERSASHTYASNQVPLPSLSHTIRLREGEVKFNYRYYNNLLQRSEVTENFSCPFCSAKCASYKGLRCHLLSSHDLFTYEFSASEEYPIVNVSVKSDNWEYKDDVDVVDPKVQTFMYCAKPLKHAMLEDEPSDNAEDAGPPESTENPAEYAELLEKADDGVADAAIVTEGVSNAAIQSHPDPDGVPPVSVHDDGAPAAVQAAKTGKSRMESSDLRKTALLRKRRFYHSHKGQPMELEEVLSDADSEVEIDDEVADIEDRRMLDNFVDVTDDEKKFMHMWNSFVRRQRLRADGHIPWACAAFIRLHGLEIVQSLKLTWKWRLFTIKLWNHGLLDPRTINQCSVILEEYQQQISDPRS